MTYIGTAAVAFMNVQGSIIGNIRICAGWFWECFLGFRQFMFWQS